MADKDITAAVESLSAFGSVRLFDGRGMRRDEIGNAEILLVRAVTRVDEPLLKGTAIRFVGSATAGIDHVDIDYLNEAGIEFAYAAGCNARAVAEHVVSLIYLYAESRSQSPRDLSVGVVGYGHVGRALGAMLDQLGVDYVVNDPPLGDELTANRSASLERALDCDVVSLHVPLTDTGKYPTLDLVNAARLGCMRPRTLLVNAARGGVVDESALRLRLDGDQSIFAAIDCWSNEPNIDPKLLRGAWMATPHIAGHTLEARLEAMRILHAALNVFLMRSDAFPSTVSERLPMLKPASNRGGLAPILSNVHPLADQTYRLRRLLALPATRRGAHFDDVRRRYGLRREFASYDIACDELAPDTVAELGTLGFTCVDPYFEEE